MNKLLWKIYYLFVTPKNKSEVAVRYCRINGKPYIKLKLAKVDCDEIKGMVD